jgi:multidrug efflux pump subunit AcrA (membrane-fusion protein)
MSLEMRRPCLIRLTWLFGAALAFGGAGCTGGKDEGDKAAKSDKAAAGPNGGGGGKGGRPGRGGPVSVRTEKAAFAVSPRRITLVAPLLGRSQADVYPKVSGRLSAMLKKEGDTVKENELLFRVDRSDPGESFLTTPVLSPLSGWVGRWIVASVGEQVSPTTPVVTIVDDAALRATIFLPTAEWLAVSPATQASVAIGGQSRPGKVIAVARAADAASARGSVIIEVDNAQHEWRAGMIGRVTLELEPKRRMLVSAAALTITDTGAYVYVVKDQKAARLLVEYVVVDNDTVEITKGVDDGADVVVAGAKQLTEGAVVAVHNTH